MRFHRRQMKRLGAQTFGATAAALLAACSGGGSHATPSMGPAPHASSGTASAKRNVTFTITIPPRTKTALAKRYPKYVSSGTTQALLTLTNSANPSLTTTAIVSLTPGSPNCSMGTNLVTVCTVNALAVIGTSALTVQLEDASSDVLSVAANVPITVAEGTSAVTVPLILGGVPEIGRAHV